MTTSTDTWLTDLRHWHDQRDAQATAAHGTAALTGTHWLDATPEPIEGLPGTWSALDGRIVGTAPGLRIDLGPGDRHALGDRELVALVRAGRLALRVFDPAAPTRTTLAGIESFEPDPAWVLTGTAERTENNEIATQPLKLEHIDGFVSDNTGVRVRLEIGGAERVLQAAAAADGALQLTFSDTTVGDETENFRFLTIPAPDAAGRIVADFNRAYLPPCTFTDHYLCPLPPAGNRLDLPVRAGESRLRRAE
ncbi:DUF1684 domain-containing protein [Nocardia sp. alder85J]|uniref:DUF1684 domain-containing protein n=1 Tax=Nocardia sp. alder85J TaxID=2862949 RepID=UPI001CD3A0EF|nr:DUF1684 domain-containing protein [Nocardia sp. alder85J]MCX4095913.1 DUF1684 domain-containing protein [Nocardia sp. alder85J]